MEEETEQVLSGDWYKDRETFERVVSKYKTNSDVERATGVSEKTIRRWRSFYGMPPTSERPETPVALSPTVDDYEWILEAVRKRGNISVPELADLGDCSPRKVREGLAELSSRGYQLGEVEDERGVVLHKPNPSQNNLHPGLFEGEEQTFGVVSDTHLGSKEEALEELHVAYDVFADNEVTEVLHAGDLVAGKGIYRTQDSEIKVFTLDSQVEYAVENYPEKDGITTHIIGGNHDLEGQAGKVGFDPVAAFARERDDVNYLGQFSGWLGCHGGSWIHLMHGSGGMSYAYSYKAQKLAEAYPPGRKPALGIYGHWHVEGNFTVRNIKVMFPGCFEWQSYFMLRRGLQPVVGFHIIHCRFADDGSLVEYTPRFFQFFEGREVELG